VLIALTQPVSNVRITVSPCLARCQEKNPKYLAILLSRVYYFLQMDPKIAAALKAERVRIARLGGQGRAKKLTAGQRRASAIKASKAAAKARTRKAKARNNQNG